MAERRRIAIAIDSSEYAENAFDWYMQYLHHPQNELLCIHVPEGFDVNKAQKELAKGGVMKETTERVYSKITELEERYHHKLHHHQACNPGGVRGTTLPDSAKSEGKIQEKVRGTVLSVPSKSPGQTIIDTANEERCFAIVIGTKGRSKIQKALMGSVSDYVLKNSNVPVIIVKKKRAKDDK